MTGPRVLVCDDCGTTEGVAIYGKCGPCLDKHADAERLAQGLPINIEDPEVLDKIDRIIAHLPSSRAS